MEIVNDGKPFASIEEELAHHIRRGDLLREENLELREKLETLENSFPVLVFGHGEISVCTTQEDGHDHINGLAFILNDDVVPIGEPREHQVGKALDELKPVVQLLFDNVESLNVVLRNLERVKAEMLAIPSTSA